MAVAQTNGQHACCTTITAHVAEIQARMAAEREAAKGKPALACLAVWLSNSEYLLCLCLICLCLNPCLYLCLASIVLHLSYLALSHYQLDFFSC